MLRRFLGHLLCLYHHQVSRVSPCTFPGNILAEPCFSNVVAVFCVNVWECACVSVRVCECVSGVMLNTVASSMSPYDL